MALDMIGEQLSFHHCRGTVNFWKTFKQKKNTFGTSHFIFYMCIELWWSWSWIKSEEAEVFHQFLGWSRLMQSSIVRVSTESISYTIRCLYAHQHSLLRCFYTLNIWEYKCPEFSYISSFFCRYSCWINIFCSVCMLTCMEPTHMHKYSKHFMMLLLITLFQHNATSFHCLLWRYW